ANSYTYCSTRGTFSNDDADYRHLQHKHFFEIAGNGFRLTAFFSFKTRKRTRGIDESDNRLIEFFCQPEQAQVFTITFRVGHTKIPVLSLLCVSPFLLSDEHDRLTVDGSKTAYHGFITCNIAVSMQL